MWTLISRLSPVVLGAVGASLYYDSLKSEASALKSKEHRIVSSEIHFKDDLKKDGFGWDFNWDKRDALSLLKPPANDEKIDEKELEKHQSKATRHILLIRHGQFQQGETDTERVLTMVGREQAKLTGQRLLELELPITEVISSTLSRAKKTGQIILEQLQSSELENIKFQLDEHLVEGAPAWLEPADWQDWEPEPYVNIADIRFFKEGSRIEAAFRSHFYRAPPEQEKDSYTVLVCHANVIRYFVYRALQFPPEAWLRFDLNHSSITWLVLRHDGAVFLRMFGSSGHLPAPLITSVNEEKLVV